MCYILQFVILFLAAIITNADINFDSINKDVHLIPPGKHLIFDYEVQVKLGVLEPTKQTSLLIKSNLHVQGLPDNKIGLYLNNFTTDLKHESTVWEDVDFPKNLEALELPFNVELDKNGKVDKFFVNTNDETWSINVKKSISSLLQVDNRVFKTFNGSMYVGNSNENSIHGVCLYDVQISSHNDEINLIKTQVSKTCDDYDVLEIDNYATRSVNRFYQYKIKENGIFISKIESNGNYLLSPEHIHHFHGYVNSYQTLELISINDIENTIKIDNEKSMNLKINGPLDNCKSNALDLTSGRELFEQDQLIKQFDNIFNKIINKIQSNTNWVTLEQSNFKEILEIQDLLKLLERFDFEMLEKCLEHIKGDHIKYNSFVTVLPYVGTRPSLILLRNIIRELSTNEKTIKLLMSMPDHIKCPSDELVVKLEDMLHFNSSNSKVFKASVLSFANILRKTFKHNEQSLILNKYIDMFVKELYSDINDFETKVLYLQALGNLEMESTIPYLEPILSGKYTVDPLLRKLAILSHESVLVNDLSSLDKYIWPILKNTFEDTDLRIVAYIILIKQKQTSLQHFVDIHNLLSNDANEKLYAFHYNTMLNQEIECTGNNLECVRATSFRTLMKTARKPVAFGSREDGFLVTNVGNDHEGLRLSLEAIKIESGNLKTFDLRLMTNVNNIKVEYMSIYISFTVKDVTSIKDDGTESETTENALFKVTSILRRSGRAVYLESDDKFHFDHLATFFNALYPGQYFAWSDDSNIQFLSKLSLLEQNLKIIPLDFGFPLILRDNIPNLISMKTDLNQESNKLEVDISWKRLTFRDSSLSMYNPLNQLYHSVQKVNSITLEINLKVVVEYNRETPAVKVVLEMPQDNKNIYGIQTDVFTETLLYSTNAEQKTRITNRIGNEVMTRNQDNMVHKNLPTIFGIKFNVKSFYCEKPVSINRLEKGLFSDDLDDDTDTPIIGNCGIGLYIQPMPNIDRIEFDIKLKGGAKMIKNNFDSDVELNIKTATKLINGTDFYRMDLNTTLYKKSENMKFTVDSIHHGLGIITRTFNIVSNIKLMEDHFEFNTSLSTKLVSRNEPTTIDLVTKVIKSDEQEKITQGIGMPYSECQKLELKWNINFINLAQCAEMAFSLRKYILDIKLNNVKNDPFMNYLLKTYFEDNDETHYQLEVVFPIFESSKADVKLIKGTSVQTTKDIELNSMVFDILSPMNLVMTSNDKSLFDYLDTCVVSHNYLIKSNGMKKQITMSDSWTPFVESGLLKFSTKKIDTNRTAIELILPDEKNVTQTLKIEPTVEGFQVKHNNNLINLDGLNVQKKVQSSNGGEYVKMSMNVYPKILFLIYFNHVEILFDGQTVGFYLLNDYDYDGKCY